MRMRIRHTTCQIQGSSELKITMIFNDNGVNIPFLLIQLIKILTVSIYIQAYMRGNIIYMFDESPLMHSGKKATL